MNNNTRQQYLDAIGIQSWQLKSALDNELPDCFEDDSLEIVEQPHLVVQESQSIVQEPQLVKQEPQPVKQEPQPVINEPQSFENTSQPVISGSIDQIPVKALDKEDLDECVQDSTTISEDTAFDSELVQAIKNCKQCSSRQTRLNAVSGQGNSNASVFIISEPPNAEEDRSGHYLTEQTMPLFDSMLQSINANDDYFFTGIIKCYSLSNYLFSEEEIDHCSSYLHMQIEQTNPSVLLVLGAIQAQSILRSKKSFNELRGKTHYLKINDKEYPVVVTYHPAYLLRNPLYKREALKDLIMVKYLIK